MANSSVRYVVRFIGNVQGVGFRATSIHVAQGLDVHGFVRNEFDGSVTLDVDGDEPSLKNLIGRIQNAMERRIDHTEIDKFPSENRSGGLHIRG